MKKIGVLLTIGVLLAQQAGTTVVFAVGTRDGLLVCEDDRELVYKSIVRTSLYGLESTITNLPPSADKIQKLIIIEPNGIASVAGDFRHDGPSSKPNAMSLFQTPFAYDIRTKVREFFDGAHSQDLDSQTMTALLASLQGLLYQDNVYHSADVFLYWTNTARRLQVYHLSFSNSNYIPSPCDANAHLAPISEFVNEGRFQSTEPLVSAAGECIFNRMKNTDDPEFAAFRDNSLLKPYLTNYKAAHLINSSEAIQALNLIVREISSRESAVGENLDCALLNENGVKPILGAITH